MKPAGRVVIAGGTGFLGLNLARHLSRIGCEVIVISRHEPETEAGWHYLLLGTDPELALYGRYCVSRRLREEGFEFRYPELRSALRNLHDPSGTPTR